VFNFILSSYVAVPVKLTLNPSVHDPLFGR